MVNTFLEIILLKSLLLDVIMKSAVMSLKGFKKKSTTVLVANHLFVSDVVNETLNTISP